MTRSVWGARRRFRVPSGYIVIGLLALVVIAIALARQQPDGARLVGRAEAGDGDTLRRGSVRVRLLGLDAPELDQTCTRPDGGQWSCGREAKSVVTERLRAGPVECARHGRDIYGRTLAKCAVEGADLGAGIVRDGWAVNDGGYATEASEAQTQHIGIWSGTFVHPADWRRSHTADQLNVWEWIRSWFQ